MERNIQQEQRMRYFRTKREHGAFEKTEGAHSGQGMEGRKA